MDEQEKENLVTPCMDVYKANIESIVSLGKLKLRIVVRIDLHNKELIGGIWSPTSSTRPLNYFLEDATKHKERVHKLDYIEEFPQANVKHRVLWS